MNSTFSNRKCTPRSLLRFSLPTATIAAVLACSIGGLNMPQSSAAEPPLPATKSPLDSYVAEPDTTFAWQVVDTIQTGDLRTTVIKLKSQSWRSKEDVDRPVWEHWLTIVTPKKVTSDRAFLLIGGGSHTSKQPNSPDGTAAAIAKATGGIVAELKNVPNQPLVFHQDGAPRVEDDLIAYGWDQFLRTDDPTWLPQLPMAKSAVRAMDCVQEFLASDAGGNHPITKFVVGGASKRGWTTWLTAIADDRVEAIVPIVIDVLNVDTSLRHHAQVYGFWVAAIGDYYRHRIMERFDAPKLQNLHAIVDPFSYRDRLTMHKYIVNAAGDQFFLPDSSRFYFSELPGENLLRYIPNADHSLKNTDAAQSIGIYYSLIAQGKERPKYSWTFEDDGSIRVKCPTKPSKVLLWQAHNPTNREFRLEKLGPAFKSTELLADAEGNYVAPAPANTSGWTASLVELTYDVGGPYPLIVTTAVRITPDTRPFEGIDLSKVPFEPELGDR